MVYLYLTHYNYHSIHLSVLTFYSTTVDYMDIFGTAKGYFRIYMGSKIFQNKSLYNAEVI